MPLYELTTVEPIERTYQIEADSEEDARRRFERRTQERQVMTNTSSYYMTSKSIDVEKREEKVVSLKPLDEEKDDLVEFMYPTEKKS